VRSALVGLLLLGACGGQRATVPALVDAQQASKSPSAELAKKLAPQAVAEADATLKLAERAREDGDDVGAALYADRAVAGYQRALMLARTARATADLAGASQEIEKADTERRALIAQRADADRQGEELQKKLFLAHELASPAQSGPADPTREAARLAAARSLALGARLLCGAARLVDAQTEGLKAEDDKLTELDKKLDGTPKPVPIDDAARIRAECLGLLTKARRAHPPVGPTSAADPLLTELSAAGNEPSRDERGVVVTLHDVFAGAALSRDAEAKLKALGRVASAHPAVAVQVVVHDAVAQPPARTRADAARAALISGGAKDDKVAAEMGGTRAPIVDPSDAKDRARNSRVEVVFVTAD
jgi:hypothetical protein